MTRHEDADPRRPRRRMRWGPAACLAALALLALPSLAAAKCTPIPGRSALDQYCESVPGAGGDSPPRRRPARRLRQRLFAAAGPGPRPGRRRPQRPRAARLPREQRPHRLRQHHPQPNRNQSRRRRQPRRRQPRGRQRQQPPPRRQERRQHRPQHRPHLPLDTDRHSPTPHRPRLAPLPHPPPLTERSDVAARRDRPGGSGCQRQRLTWRSTSRGTERTRMRPCSSTNGSRTRMRCLTDT